MNAAAAVENAKMKTKKMRKPASVKRGPVPQSVLEARAMKVQRWPLAKRKHSNVGKPKDLPDPGRNSIGDEPVRIHKDGNSEHWVEYQMRVMDRFQITRYEYHNDGLKAGGSSCVVASFENAHQAQTAKLAFEMYERCRRNAHTNQQDYIIVATDDLGEPEGLIFYAYGEQGVNDRLIQLSKDYPNRNWDVAARINKSRNGLIE